MIKRRVPIRHLVSIYTALYAPPTPAMRAEASRLMALHCARIERGVPIDAPTTDSRQGALFGEGGTSRRCPDSETTPAGEARCSGDASAQGWSELLPGDSPPIAGVA